MSRIRQIKPSWFLDKDLRRGTTADAREFYIGLWMLADDAGYLEWDPERIGAELYPFDPIAKRERMGDDPFDDLVGDEDQGGGDEAERAVGGRSRHHTHPSFPRRRESISTALIGCRDIGYGSPPSRG